MPRGWHHLHRVVVIQRGQVPRVRVDFSGNEGPVEVMLMDPREYEKYKSGATFEFYGGKFESSPVEVRVTGPGLWHAVVEAKPAGQVRAEVTAG